MSITIRPHHALCIPFFEGKGYSADFVRHMYKVIEALGENPRLTLSGGCDTLCAACPHNRGGVCDSAEKVAAFDSRALSYMGLSVGDALTWEELSALAQEKIIRAGKLSEVCRGCQWTELCMIHFSNKTA